MRSIYHCAKGNKIDILGLPGVAELAAGAVGVYITELILAL